MTPLRLFVIAYHCNMYSWESDLQGFGIGSSEQWRWNDLYAVCFCSSYWGRVSFCNKFWEVMPAAFYHFCDKEARKTCCKEGLPCSLTALGGMIKMSFDPSKHLVRQQHDPPNPKNQCVVGTAGPAGVARLSSWWWSGSAFVGCCKGSPGAAAWWHGRWWSRMQSEHFPQLWCEHWRSPALEENR